MIHYHGTPITPETCALRALRGRHAFISWSTPHQLPLAAAVCQSFALDNGAFSVWRATGQPVTDWGPYYAWTASVLTNPSCDWAIIPDVIGGSEADNDALLTEWPHGHRGVPVWHLDESIDRLVRLAAAWPRVALGSAADYDVSTPDRAVARMNYALPAICDSDGAPLVKLHGLRMLNPAIVTRVPLASADSTNVARNIGIDKAWRRSPYAPATNETRTDVLVERIEQHQSPPRLTRLGYEPMRLDFDNHPTEILD